MVSSEKRMTPVAMTITNPWKKYWTSWRMKPPTCMPLTVLTLYSTDTHFDTSTTVFENIVGKGKICRKEQFLLFPQCFLLNQIIISPFVHIFDIISLFADEFKEPKIGLSGKKLALI